MFEPGELYKNCKIQQILLRNILFLCNLSLLMLHISMLSSSDRLSCIEDAMLVSKMGRDLHVSYCVFPSRISDNCDEHREHTLYPGTIEISKDDTFKSVI